MTIYNRVVIIIMLTIVSLSSFAQTTSTIAGSDGIWSTAANWNNGVPAGGGTNAIINKSLILNANLNFGSGTGGTYTINSPVTDLTGGTAHGITVSNSGTLDVNANLTIEGPLSVTNSATLIVESGDTLTVGGASISQSTTIIIRTGGVVIVNGNVNVSNSSGIACDGEFIINGNYVSSNSSNINGSGTMTTTGTITSNGSSSIFGSGNNCTTGPCSGNNLCASNSNMIAASQSICSGNQPAQLTDVINPGGTYAIQWQSSITSGTGGFTNITNATSLNYQPSALSQNTWFRRVIIQGTCTAISPSLQILVGTPAITSQPSDFSICGTSGTATFSVTASGGTQLTYQWKVNGNNITNGAAYSGATTSTLTVNATSAMNGNTYQCVVTNPGCSVSATSNSAKLIVSSSTPSAPSVNSASGAICSQMTANWAAITNATGYYLDVATDNAFSSMVTGYNSKNVGNVTSSIITGLTAGTTYYYRVRAYSSCGISSSSGAISASISPCTFNWVGGVSTNWATAGNWSDNVVPGSGNDVTIPSGTLHIPIISGIAETSNLTVQSGATLNNNLGGNLSIAGNFTNSGSFSDTGTVVLNGSTNQTIAGVSAFNNLTLNNTSGAKLSNDLTIKGILTLTQGALNPNGNLLTINLNSGAISGSGTGSITEPIKVVKTVGTKWHHIGNPLGGSTVLFSQLTEHITVANGVLFKYNETVPSTIMEDGWVEIPTTSFSSTPMSPMIGYNMYVWPKKTNLDIVGMYNHNYSTSVSLTNTSTGTPLSDGWNFLSNPYPSTIDWDEATGWTKSGLDNAIYVYDKSNERYMSYINGNSINGGSRYISSMQGFWVKGNVASGSISINKNARVTSPVLKLYKGQTGTGKIKLSLSNNGYSDETIINLNSNGTSNFDQSLDAYKLKNKGSNPNISSQLNGVEYSINTISDTIVDEIIPLRIKTAFVGQYQISVDLSEFQSDMEITLIDKKSNVSQDLKLVSDYVFGNSNVDTNRFYIRLKNKVSISTGLISKNNNNVIMGSDGSIVTIKLNSDLSTATMSVLNILGNEVYHNQVNMTGGLIREQLNVPNSGIYIIKLKVGDQVYTGRVFIK